MEKKLSIGQMLEHLKYLEDIAVDAKDFEQMKELVGDIKGKADNYHEFITRLEAEQLRLKGVVTDLLKRIKSLENAQKSVKDYLVYAMVEHDMPVIKGNMFDLKLRKRKSISVRDMDCDKAAHERLGSDLVRAQYILNKTAVKEAYKADPEKFEDLVEHKESKYVQFTSRKIY